MKNNIVAAIMEIDAELVKTRMEKTEKGKAPTATLLIPTDDGVLELDLNEFDGMYRGFVRLWPVVKPLKTELITIARQHEADEKKARVEAELAEKKARKEASMARRTQEREKASAEKEAAEKEKEKVNKAKAAVAEKKRKEKEAKAKAKAKADAKKLV